jgi:predicted nucleic acid-binding protein
MRLVADTNCIISALIKNSVSRKIIINTNFKFYTPDFTLEEIRKHKLLICEKAGITEKNFEILIMLLFEKIEVVPKQEYEQFINKSKHLTDDIDDVPFFACAIAIKTEGIWSDDKHFEKQNQIKVWKTKDLTKFL